MKYILGAAAICAMVMALSYHLAVQPQRVSLCPEGQKAKLVGAFVQDGGEHDVTVMCVRDR